MIVLLLRKKKKEPKLLQILSAVCYASFTGVYPSVPILCRGLRHTFLKAGRKTVTINRIIQFW